ncbi:hypothetical protein DPMN_094875 [Dreissena polymorpha]|uniref:Uncharacterized protein n=1 Tax=Dreissena polymorpha TaxID=45954 RepID=A0A9D4L6U3_DREPO|nr:hypothetical protein DPMN_094875 [Dreissena polymorpha]
MRMRNGSISCRGDTVPHGQGIVLFCVRWCSFDVSSPVEDAVLKTWRFELMVWNDDVGWPTPILQMDVAKI